MKRKRKARNRERMMVDIPERYQHAIRLRALKDGTTIGKIIERAMDFAFPVEVVEARKHIEARSQPKETHP